MPIILPLELTSPEIRVLQEYRRLAAENLPLTTLAAIKHPAGGGETPALSLVGKGFLVSDGTGENLALSGPARDFLAIESKPSISEPSEASSTDSEAKTGGG